MTEPDQNAPAEPQGDTGPAPTQQPPAEPAKPEIDWKAEARKWEQRAKEWKPAADRLKQVEDSQKTDLQRMQDQLASVSRERDDARVDATRVRLGLRYKLDEPDLEFLGAGSDEEMETRAKRLAERVGSARPPSFDGGARKASDAPADMNSYLRRLAGR
jgi:hypothetical protein